MRPEEAFADLDRHGVALAEQLLKAIDPTQGGFAPVRIDAAAHQLLWRRYMVTGSPALGDAVVASLRAICRSPRVAAQRERTLGDDAQLLECLTWVWRQTRCAGLRQNAEAIATSAVDRLRLPGAGFSARCRDGAPDGKAPADANGLMLVALVEAGSVLERREWLALAREVFDEIVAAFAEGDTMMHEVTDGRRGMAATLDDYAMMSRAAVRLFEAFGKQRYLDNAEAWVATLDAAFWDEVRGGYCATDAGFPTTRACSITDGVLPSGNALMIGLLARLHALTGKQDYAARVGRIVAAFRNVIMRAGIAGATAVANGKTAANLVSIKVSGDPRLAETREMMRIALDCALPDRLVLGPGAGGTPDERPRARIRVGTRRLAEIDDTARLRAVLAPGGLAGEV